MSENLFVDPIELYMSSDHLSMHQGELHATHAEADRVIDEVQEKWVGASATALRAEHANWRAESDGLIGDITDQCVRIRCAADECLRTDEAAAHVVGRLR